MVSFIGDFGFPILFKCRCQSEIEDRIENRAYCRLVYLHWISFWSIFITVSCRCCLLYSCGWWRFRVSWWVTVGCCVFYLFWFCIGLFVFLFLFRLLCFFRGWLSFTFRLFVWRLFIIIRLLSFFSVIIFILGTLTILRIINNFLNLLLNFSYSTQNSIFLVWLINCFLILIFICININKTIITFILNRFNYLWFIWWITIQI